MKLALSPVEFAHFCDHVSIDMDGKLNFIGVFDHIVIKKLPALQRSMNIAIKLLLPEGEHSLTIAIMQEDKVLGKTDFEKTITGKIGSHTHIWRISNLKIDSLENMEMHVLRKGKKIYAKNLPIVQSGQVG